MLLLIVGGVLGSATFPVACMHLFMLVLVYFGMELHGLPKRTPKNGPRVSTNIYLWTHLSTELHDLWRGP